MQWSLTNSEYGAKSAMAPPPRGYRTHGGHGQRQVASAAREIEHVRVRRSVDNELRDQRPLPALVHPE